MKKGHLANGLAALYLRSGPHRLVPFSGTAGVGTNTLQPTPLTSGRAEKWMTHLASYFVVTDLES